MTSCVRTGTEEISLYCDVYYYDIYMLAARRLSDDRLQLQQLLAPNIVATLAIAIATKQYKQKACPLLARF